MYYILTLYYKDNGKDYTVRSVHNSLSDAYDYKLKSNASWYENSIYSYTKEELKHILTYYEFISHFGIEFKTTNLIHK